MRSPQATGGNFYGNDKARIGEIFGQEFGRGESDRMARSIERREEAKTRKCASKVEGIGEHSTFMESSRVIEKIPVFSK
jgi:hypothetical protein